MLMPAAASPRDRGFIRLVRVWAVWFLLLALVTTGMVAVRARLNEVHVALAYLVVVQLASARSGRAIGLALSAAAFLAFNWFFLPPYGTLVLQNPLDWIVLGAFLITSVISAQLLYRVQSEAELAIQRAAEVERLAAEASQVHALQESHRAKDAVLAAVSHDLRTPLTTIKGLAHEIASDGDERAETIEEEANRLSAFVTKLLDLSRVTMGSAALDIQANEAEDLLGAAAQQVQGSLQGHALHIRIEPSAALLFGRFDFAQTLRALVNLIENAVKYSPPGREIEVGARRVGAALHFWVADRGRGVPEAERERIFDAFYRPVGTEPDVGGTGLGLSIARGIAEAQGGSVEYAARPGGGSLFTLAVPAMDLPVETELPQETAQPTIS
jgi:K+-sensing histidine kinase KdpD